MYAVICTTVAMHAGELSRSEASVTFASLGKAQNVAHGPFTQGKVDDSGRHLRFEVGEMTWPVPDTDRWNFVETFADPEQTARIMFRELPAEVQTDCRIDALWHRDNGGGKYTPDDDWRVWLESDPQAEALVLQRAVYRAGYIVANVKTRWMDGRSEEWVCRRIPVTVVR